MKVGVLKVTLYIPYAHSLKEKRKVIRKIKDRLHARFNCSVAEVGDQNLWQKATFGISIVGINSRDIDSVLKKILNLIDECFEGDISSHQLDIFPF